MVEGLTKVGVITLLVDDPARSKSFYARVFGLAVADEAPDGVVMKFDNLLVNFLERRGGPEILEPAPIAAADAGATLMFTIWVKDVDATVDALAGDGVTLLNGPIDRPWGVRTAVFQDPDGYAWELAQPLDA